MSVSASEVVLIGRNITSSIDHHGLTRQYNDILARTPDHGCLTLWTEVSLVACTPTHGERGSVPPLPLLTIISPTIKDYNVYS